MDPLEINPRRRSCRECTRPTTRYITRASNRKGNAGRPYFNCTTCDLFAGFDDDRGIQRNNPTCKCGEPSRMQVAGKENVKVPRGLHYVCATGQCDFYEAKKGNGGGQLVVDDDELVSLMIRFKIV